MRKRVLATLLTVVLAAACVTACGAKKESVSAVAMVEGGSGKIDESMDLDASVAALEEQNEKAMANATEIVEGDKGYGLAGGITKDTLNCINTNLTTLDGYIDELQNYYLKNDRVPKSTYIESALCDAIDYFNFVLDLDVASLDEISAEIINDDLCYYIDLLNQVNYNMSTY